MHPRALLGATHPLPSLAVTVLATSVAAAAGRSAGGCLLVATAVLTGQLSIGWLNDLLDRDHDHAAGRRDKDRGLSAGEKRMLSKARQILVSELALAEGTNEDKAEVLLDEVLAS